MNTADSSRPKPWRSEALVWVSIGAGAIFWIVDSAADAFIFDEGGFGDQFAAPDPMHAWMRLTVASLLVGFGVYAHFGAKRRKGAEEAARESEKTVRRLAHENSVLAEIGRIIGSSLQIDEVYEPFVREVGKIIPLDAATITIADIRQANYTVAYTMGLTIPVERRVGRVVPFRGSAIGDIIDTRAGLVVEMEDEDELMKRVPGLVPTFRAGYRSHISVPLLSRGEVIGALHFDSVGRKTYGEKDLELAQRVGDQIAGAIANAQLYAGRERAAEALRESEEHFRSVAETATDGIISSDAAGNIVFWNHAAETTFGYSAEEVFGQPVSLVIPQRYRDAHRRGLDRLSSTGEHRIVGKTVELSGLKKDGREFPLELALSTWRAGDNAFFTGIIRDITERKLLQEQLVQAQKMEVVGRLAGGVAHDFNNLLTPIMAYAVMARERLSPNDSARGYLQEIQTAADRAATLTRQLLAFSRHQATEARVIDLNGLVLDMDKMLRRTIGEDIELVSLPDPEPCMVMADPGLMEQVLMNMAVNARDAMLSGGQLTIETASITLDEESARRLSDLAPGGYVRLSVRDTGIGMDAEVASHIFEPFFTTKGVGEGTGLGLATCYGIVKEGKGDIRVQSEPGAGATFEVYLPRVEEQPAEVVEGRESGDLPTGTETVLVVEDEPSVRRLAVEVLRRQGYTVLEKANGEEALRAVEEHGGNKPHLLLTDVVMPRMGGRELAGRLQSSLPGLKVLLMTGYSGDVIIGEEVSREDGARVMHKPFTPVELARRVRKALD